MTEFNPHRTQRIRVEIEKIGSTDSHRVNELLLHAIEQNENMIDGVDHDLKSFSLEMRTRFDNFENYLRGALVSEDRVRNLISGAILADKHARSSDAKRYYGGIFLKYILPAAITSGISLSALFHHLAWWHR